MIDFLRTRLGRGCLGGFVLLMGFVFQRIAARHAADNARPNLIARSGEGPAGASRPAEATVSVGSDEPAVERGMIAENAASLDQYYALGQRGRPDRDRQGNGLTRRDTPAVAVLVPPVMEEAASPPPPGGRGSLRLEGRGAAATRPPSPAPLPDPAPPAPVASVDAPIRQRPGRFNPYGRVIRCELVFTIDSTNEQTPLVALVMDPVHNNGRLVIPAGAELHGVTRPDRLRNRIFSGTDWVLVFPREEGRPNGRQLNVRGVALNRVEPDSNGMTWGITDGSYGLEGVVIRTLQQEEIKRFVATFLASGAMGLQERHSGRGGQTLATNTPQNAILQGFAANFQRIVDDITAEIEKHGAFLRVPAGHQFYFYPMQIIDPDAADISADIATVK